MNHQLWSRAILVKPKDHLESHARANIKPFVASFETSQCPPSMSCLLGWEYGRMWVKERDKFVAERKRKTAMRHKLPDYSKWLEMHKPKKKESKENIFLGSK
ncbi:uncharacterized protein LOC119679807 [Teleopsis dalmanni]|uniref:uncharacterized protein LOC119679807 n=1 Tax=Teleopsis dalmanni TaxID=139649 RepID=UPI0018CCC3D9|nr:uncharacterized protein LOC119679807 [Teleopsis dalmanni]